MFFKSLIEETIEFQNRDGINPLTIGFFVAIIVLIIQAWGLLDQNRKISKQTTEKLLPIYFFVCQFFYFTGYVLYGFDLRSATIMISNISGLFMLLIIINLIKHKRINIRQEINKNKREIMKKQFKQDLLVSSLLTAALLAVMIFIKDKDALIIVLLGFVIISIIPLAIGIFRAKNFKIIGVNYLLAFIFSSVAWIVYGLIVSLRWNLQVRGLIISSLATLAVATVLLILRLKFNRKNP